MYDLSKIFYISQICSLYKSRNKQNVPVTFSISAKINKKKGLSTGEIYGLTILHIFDSILSDTKGHIAFSYLIYQQSMVERRQLNSIGSVLLHLTVHYVTKKGSWDIIIHALCDCIIGIQIW